MREKKEKEKEKERGNKKMNEKEKEKVILNVIEKLKVTEPFSSNVTEIVLLPDLDLDAEKIKEIFKITDKKILKEYENEVFVCTLCACYYKNKIALSQEQIEEFSEYYFEEMENNLQLVTFGFLIHEVSHFHGLEHNSEFSEKCKEILNMVLPYYEKHFGKVSKETVDKLWEKVIS